MPPPDLRPPDQMPVVFVVDDDLSVREALGSLIRSAGWKVVLFASAREFLAHLPEDAPSCVVLDLQLPDLNGLDLQRRMAEAQNEVPIVFISGHGDVPSSVKAMKAGAVEFLTKPLVDGDILESIQQAIARDRTSRVQKAEVAELQARYALLTPRERERRMWSSGCSTSRWPPNSARARLPSRSSAGRSRAKCRLDRLRNWCGWPRD